MIELVAFVGWAAFIVSISIYTMIRRNEKECYGFLLKENSRLQRQVQELWVAKIDD